jgi:Ser/Thr protein kinase RdoA (MazF antagonist)
MNLFDGLQRRESAAPFERLARKALTAYGMDEAQLDVVSHADHVLCRVSDRIISQDKAVARYGLHVYPRGWSRSQILRTLLWLSALRRDLPVPEPILTRIGELVQSLSTQGVSGFRQVTLLGWLDGRRLDVAEWTEEHVRDVGRLIGAVHDRATRFRPRQDLAPPRRSADTLTETIDPAELSHALSLKEESLFASAVDRVREAMSSLGSSPDVAGMIHGRLTPDHVVFGEDGAHAIGFTNARWGYFLYDLATLDLSLRALENVAGLRGSLLEGYSDARPIPANFNDHLDAFAILRLLDELIALAASLEPGAADAAHRRITRAVKALRRILADETPPPEAEREERAALE